MQWTEQSSLVRSAAKIIFFWQKGYPVYIRISVFEIVVKKEMSIVRSGEKKNIERCKNMKAGKDDEMVED